MPRDASHVHSLKLASSEHSPQSRLQSLLAQSHRFWHTYAVSLQRRDAYLNIIPLFEFNLALPKILSEELFLFSHFLREERCQNRIQLRAHSDEPKFAIMDSVDCRGSFT